MPAAFSCQPQIALTVQGDPHVPLRKLATKRHKNIFVGATSKIEFQGEPDSSGELPTRRITIEDGTNIKMTIETRTFDPVPPMQSGSYSAVVISVLSGKSPLDIERK